MKLVIAVAALLGSGTALAQVPQWTVSESSGTVSILRPGFSGAAARGGIVRAGDTVSTGKSGRAVLVRGDEYLVVSPGSRIVIAEPKAGGMTQIIQSVGNTLFKIKKMATPHFAVETPYLAAVVKGTTFSVTVTETAASVQVTEGRVQVQTPDGGASYLVTPGVIGVVNRDQPYRLKVHGRETLTIDSPAAPAGAGPSQSVPAEIPAVEQDVSRTERIAAAVGEGPVSLAAISTGLVSGDSTLVAAATSQRATRIAGVVPPVGAAAGTTAPPAQGGIETANGGVAADPVPVEVATRTGTGVGDAGGNSGGDGGSGTGAGSTDSGGGVSVDVGVGVGGSANTDVGASVGDGSAGAGNNGNGVGVDAGVGTGDATVDAGANVGDNGNANASVSAGGGSANGGGNGTGNNGNGLGNGGGDGSNGIGGGNGNTTSGIGVDAGAGGGGVTVDVGANVGGNGNTNAGVAVGAGGNGNGNNGNGLGNGGGDGSNGNGNGRGFGWRWGNGNNGNGNGNGNGRNRQ